MQRPKHGDWVQVNKWTFNYIGYVDYCTEHECYIVSSNFDKPRKENLSIIHQLGSYIDDDDKRIMKELYIDLALQTGDKEWFRELTEGEPA